MLYSISFWNEFYLLFSEMSAISAICLILGLMLVVVEIFQPSRKLFASLGGALLLVGIIVRLWDNGSIAMFLGLVAVLMGSILFAYILMLVVYKKAWLMRTPQLSSTIHDTTKDFYFLLNLEGIAQTVVSNKGVILINGVEFDAIAQADSIDKDSRVKVVEVEGTRIVVKKIS